MTYDKADIGDDILHTDPNIDFFFLKGRYE